MEIWKKILGYENYEVSNFGRIKSLEKIDFMHRNNSYRTRKEKIMRNGISNGYKSVSLYKNKKPKTFTIHRLVLSSFIENKNNKREVNHIDGNKHNNNLENLEWCSSSENSIHAIKNGLQIAKKGEQQYNSKLKDFEIIEIRNSDLTLNELSKIYNISTSVICSVKNKKSWKHI